MEVRLYPSPCIMPERRISVKSKFKRKRSSASEAIISADYLSNCKGERLESPSDREQDLTTGNTLTRCGMGFERGALLGPLESLRLDQSADLVPAVRLFKARGLGTRFPAAGKCHPPAFSSLQFLAPLLSDPWRDAYLVQRKAPRPPEFSRSAGEGCPLVEKCM